MLYTIADMEWVLNRELSPLNGKAAETKMKKYEMTVAGGKVECADCNGRMMVSRLISTNPKMYLDKRFFPGTVWDDKTE